MVSIKAQWLERIARAVHGYSAIHSRYLTKHVGDFSLHFGHRGLILDIGSGTSPYTDLFSYGNYISLDIRADSGADVVGDVCSLPFEDQIADVIVCTEVLEHVPNTGKALMELRRVLKTSAFLVLTTPLMWGEHEEADFFRWTEAGLRLCLQQARFEVLQFRRQGGIFSSMGEAFRQAPYQVLSPWATGPRKGPLSGISLIALAAVVPITWICRSLDRLDGRQAFTLGYSVLARKGRRPPNLACDSSD